MEKNGLSSYELSKQTGINQKTIRNWIRGTSKPTPKNMVKIADFFNYDLTLLESQDINPNSSMKSLEKPNGKHMGSGSHEDRKTNPSFIKVPVYMHINIKKPDQIYISTYVMVNSELGFEGELIGLVATSDSNSNLIEEGDIVIINIGEKPKDNGMGLICINGDNAIIRRMNYTDDGIMLTPLNPAYGTMTYSKEQIGRIPLHLVGQVVEIRKRVPPSFN